jgi:hypothetical protein
MKNILKSLVVVTALAAVVANSTLAAFTAQATVTNSTFSTGNAALRLATDLANPADPNLAETIAGPTFNNIMPLWTMDYSAKLVNAGTVNLMASVSGVFVSDTSTLSDHIFVEAFAWTDTNSDGIVDAGELGSSYGAAMPLSTWETTPIAFGQLNTGAVLPVVFRFTADDLATDLQGQTTVYDFQFNGTTDGATNP